MTVISHSADYIPSVFLAPIFVIL